jgi:uncharacterized protein
MGKADGWLKARSLTSSSVAALLSGHLDQGEAEAIALTIELEADYLLMDERMAV